MPDAPEPAPPDGERTESAGRALGWSAIGTIATFGSSIVTTLVVARLLSPQEVGVVAVPLALMNVLRGSGCQSLVITLQRHPEPTDVRAGTVLALALAWAAASGLVLVAAAPALAELFGTPDDAWAYRWIAVCVACYAVAAVPMARLARDLRFRSVARARVAAAVTGGSTVPIGLAWAGLGSGALVAGLVVAASVELVVLRLEHGRIPRARLEHARELARDASGVMGIQLSSSVALQSDNLLVGGLIGPRSLGLYSRAFRIVSIPANAVADAANLVVVGIVARRRDERERITEGLRLVADALAVTLLPLAAVVAVVADDLVRVVLGEPWLDAVPAVRALALGIFLRVAIEPKSAILIAAGHTREARRAQVAYAVGVVVLGAAGSAWGIGGVGAGVVAAQLLGLVLLTTACGRLLDHDIRAEGLAAATGTALGVAGALAAVVALSAADGAPALVRLAFAGSAGMAPLAALIALDPRRRGEVRGLLRSRA